MTGMLMMTIVPWSMSAVSHARPALTIAPTNTSAVAARRNTVMPALLGSRRRIYFRQPSQ